MSIRDWLGRSSKPSTEIPKTCAEIDMDAQQMWALECLKHLPHWACVAFAARCARQVQHTLRQSSIAPLASELESAVQLAEYSARLGQPRNGAEASARTAFKVVSQTQQLTKQMALTAARAALAVAEGPEGSEKHAFFAFHDALEAAQMVDDVSLYCALRHDLESLLQQHRREHWTSHSPVPADRFSSLQDSRRHAERDFRRAVKKATVPAAVTSSVDDLGQSDIDGWLLKENVRQWQLGDRVVIARPGIARWVAAIAAIMAWSVAGGIAQNAGGGRWGFFIAAIPAAAFCYWLVRRPSAVFLFDWSDKKLHVTRWLHQREYAFEDIEAMIVNVEQVSDSDMTDEEAVSFFATATLAAVDGSKITLLRSADAERQPEQARKAVERIAQWLAAATDWPLRRTWNDEPACADATQVRQQHRALGQIAMKRVRYRQQLDGEIDEHDLTSALGHFRAALQVDDKPNVDVLLEIAELCRAHGDHHRALEVYSVAIEAAPQRADLYSSRAFSRQCLEQYEQALADYGTAIQLQPADRLLYQSRGQLLRSRGRFEEALVDFSSCLERLSEAQDNKTLEEIRLSNRASLHAERAETYRQQGDLQNSQAEIEQALHLDPDNRFSQLVANDIRKAIDIASH